MALLIPALYGVLLFFVYRTVLEYMVGKWNGEDFTYCWIIPPLVAYLIWEKRAQLAAVPSRPSWWGLVPFLLGIGLFWLGELGAEWTIQTISLWLVLVSLCWLHLGWTKLKLIAFPLGFGLATIVPPNAIYAPMTLHLKLISSQIGVKLLQLVGVSAYREGNIIDLGFTQLQVVDACSGLRYVIPLFLMGVLLAYYYKAPLWKKGVLILSTVPLSIITNSLRIASVGVLYPLMGEAAAEGFFHDFSGWFIFMTGMAFLLLEMWLLKKIRSQESANQGLQGLKDYRGKEQRRELTPHVTTRSRYLPLVVVAVLLVSLGVAQGVNFREETPLAKPLSGLPLSLGEWQGTPTALEEQFLEVLKLSDYAMIDYRNPQGRVVSFYVAFNGSQSKGEATHSPATCLPGSGWVFSQSGTATVPRAEGSPLTVSRAVMEKNGSRQLVYFWFPQRGRVLTNLYQVKLYNFWDALTRRRTDGALVRLITPVYGDETPEHAEQRLQGVAGQLVDELDQFIPR